MQVTKIMNEIFWDFAIRYSQIFSKYFYGRKVQRADKYIHRVNKTVKHIRIIFDVDTIARHFYEMRIVKFPNTERI